MMEQLAAGTMCMFVGFVCAMFVLAAVIVGGRSQGSYISHIEEDE